MSIADELKKLADLKEAGILTQGEFDVQKAKVLATVAPLGATDPAAPHAATAEQSALSRRQRERQALLAFGCVVLAVVVGLAVAPPKLRAPSEIPVSRGPGEIPTVLIQSGSFAMGCAGGARCENDEYPAHIVTLSRDFLLGKTEVTQGQWRELMGNNPSSYSSCGLDCPVEKVTWWEALAFANAVSSSQGLAECYMLGDCTGRPGWQRGRGMWCNSVSIINASGSVYDCEGYRLPTEAEWEYAARAKADLRYAGGDLLNEVAWYEGNSDGTTHPVATKLPNAWGLHDMSGNVFEWVWDWYGSYPSSRVQDPIGSANPLRLPLRSATGEVRPRVPQPGSYRVYRGGAFTGTDSLRSGHRSHLGIVPDGRHSILGFRLARTAP